MKSLGFIDLVHYPSFLQRRVIKLLGLILLLIILKKKHRFTKDYIQNYKNLNIQFIKSTGYKKNISLMRFLDHHLLANKFERLAKNFTKPDVILCSLPTLELCSVVTKFKLQNKIPLIIDIRDLWPDIFYKVVPNFLKPIAKIIFLWQENMANYSLKNSDSIIGVSDGYLSWGINRANRKKLSFDKTIPLGYHFPNVSSKRLLDAELKLSNKGVSKYFLIFWYIGSFGKTYNLNPIIDVAKIFLEEKKDISFVISGNIDKNLPWVSEAKKIKNIVLTGWINTDEISWLRANSYVGLQPYSDIALQGLSNKTFEYLSAGLPIISSLKGENAELLQKENCGILYNNDNQESLYNAINFLVSNPKIAKEMSRKAKSLFISEFEDNKIFGSIEKLILNLKNKSK